MPRDDPRFAKVEGQIDAAGTSLKAHPPAKGEAKKAADAAQAPAGDKEAQAKAAQADKMSGAKPGKFDKAAFIAAVKQAVAAKAPQNLDEADKFASSGKAGEIKSEVMGKVTKGKEDSAKDIATKTGEAPDPAKAKDKPVTPLKDEPPPKPAAPDTASAMPAKAPPEQTDLGAGKCETDSKMAEAGVTEDQLAKSNEPQMTGALAAKKEGEQHSATAPAEVREAEDQTLQGAQQGAAQSGQAAVGAMVQGRAGVQGQVAGNKDAAKAKDETERARITGEIKKIFDATKADVDRILNDLDGAVDSKFTSGEAEAKAAFEADHTARMDRHKEQRYSGVTGAARWVADLFSKDEEADKIFLESKKVYETKMDAVISDIADHIGAELTKAKERIAKGRDQIAAFVAKEPKELQKVAKDAASSIGSQFEQLESDIESKSESLVDDLATRYVTARQAVDDRIKELQDQNKGLWEKAKDAVGGAIETIKKLKDMLMGVLARAAGAIDKIIKDPIGFLGKLINAVKGGVMRFAGNIVEHLKKGLQGWLFGTLASAGIEIPDTLDLKGVIKLVLSVLGLTWTAIRTKIVNRIGETAMKAVETGVDIFKTLVTEGVGGLWKFLLDKLSGLKDMVMGAIQDFVMVRIVKAGITWLISALNPAAAFIKACKMIYDVVMFFVEKGSQIKEFVDSVLDSIEEIASGGVTRVAGFIENTLAKILPLLIGFLASLLGLGGISDRIKELLKKVQGKVSDAIDWVINGALKLAAPIIRLAKRGAAWVKGKYEKGKAWVKEKYEKGKTWVKGKVGGAFEWVKAKLTGEKASKPVSMSGVSHTVSAADSGGEVQLTLASLFPGRLAAKLRAGQTAVSKWHDDRKVTTGGKTWTKEEVLDKLAKEIPKAEKTEKDLQAEWTTITTGLSAKQAAKTELPDAKRKWIRKAEGELAELVTTLSQIPDLEMLQNEAVPEQRWIPPGFDIRNRLYIRGKSWETVSAPVRRRDVAERISIIGLATAEVGDGRPLPNPEAQARVQARVKAVLLDLIGQWIALGWLPAPGKAGYQDSETVAAGGRAGLQAYVDATSGYLHADHKEPLATHWRKVGHDTSDAVRRAHAFDESKLEATQGGPNTSKQARESADAEPDNFTRVPCGRGFTSEFAEGGLPNARTIDSRPFLKTKDGEPID